MISVGVLGLCVQYLCAGKVCSAGSLNIQNMQNVYCFRKEMRNCFNHILIAVNVCDR
jgi:hypothetical protein